MLLVPCSNNSNYAVFVFTLYLTLRCFVPGESLFSAQIHSFLWVSWHFKEEICYAHSPCALLIKLQLDEMVIRTTVATLRWTNPLSKCHLVEQSFKVQLMDQVVCFSGNSSWKRCSTRFYWCLLLSLGEKKNRCKIGCFDNIQESKLKALRASQQKLWCSMKPGMM